MPCHTGDEKGPTLSCHCFIAIGRCCLGRMLLDTFLFLGRLHMLLLDEEPAANIHTFSENRSFLPSETRGGGMGNVREQ